MGVITSYFDTEEQALRPVPYTWADLATNDTQWEDALSWNAYNDDSAVTTTTDSTADFIQYITPITDFGRIADVNPLCEIDTSGDGDVQIEVYAADSIDSSTLLPGDPVFTTATSGTSPVAVRGRFFMWIIKKFDVEGDARIRSVRTEVFDTFQQETVNGNSTNFDGSIEERLAPLTKSYSKLLNLSGGAQKTSEVHPFITVNDLSNPGQARFTVFDLTDTTAIDSSTRRGLGDIADAGTSPSVVNNTHVNENAYAYKWAPAGIEFNVLNADEDTGNFFGNTTVTDTDDELTHGFSTVQTGEFTYEFWIKIHGSKAGIDTGDPNFSNPDHFLEITGLALKLQFQVESGNMNLFSSYGGASFQQIGTSSVIQQGGSVVGGTFVYIRVLRDGSNNLKVAFADGGTGSLTEETVATSVTRDVGSDTIKVGDLGTGTTASVFMDDIRLSNTARTNTSAPSSPLTVDSNTKMLVNGTLISNQEITVREMVPVNAVVSLLVTGLPKMTVDSDSGSIQNA